MKRIFFVLYLVLFLSSCEEDINSPNYNYEEIDGCPDPVACNFNPLADINDGTCIYEAFDSTECEAYDACQLNPDNQWQKQTCKDDTGMPFEVNWDGRQSSCGYFYQNAGYTFQEAFNDGEPCDNLVESACDDACVWNFESQVCEISYVCQDANDNSYEGWDSQSADRENECNNASVCLDHLGNNYPNFNTENECNNYFTYSSGYCIFTN